MIQSDSAPGVLVIHGPNLNMLGQREPDIYGSATLEDINTDLIRQGKKLGLRVDTYQSNHEGAIVDTIQAMAGRYQGVVINPAAYTHTSIAIRDALLSLKVPVVEIHLSNIYKREEFRHKSMIADIVTGQITGMGVFGYILALQAVAQMVRPSKA